MQKIVGFPRSLLPLLRCVRDSGQLLVCHEVRGDDVCIAEGSIRCVECSQEYQIENGIVRLMTDSLSQETQHEIVLRDEEYEAMTEIFTPPPSGWRSEFNDRIEILPHLEALQPLERCRVLELGCGDGRFTLLMAQLGAEVLAVDFSIAALRKLGSRLSSGKAPTYQVPLQGTPGPLVGRVGLVQADASKLHLAPRSFDRALSATPLDSRDERMNMYRAVAESLTDDGRYVAGVEYDDLYRRLFGLPVVRRYSRGGILIEHLDIATMRREAAPYFSRLRMQPIRAHIPFVNRLLAKWLPVALAVSVSRMVCALPVLRHLGEILLLSAERPRRLPLEGVRRPGFNAAKTFYRWYKRRQGEEPEWNADCRI